MVREGMTYGNSDLVHTKEGEKTWSQYKCREIAVADRHNCSMELLLFIITGQTQKKKNCSIIDTRRFEDYGDQFFDQLASAS